MDTFVSALIGGVLSGSVMSVIAGVLLRRRNEMIAAEVDRQFERLRGQDAWKERALTDLFGPMVMQLERTGRAFGRWNKRNPYLEARVIKEGNEAVLRLLLSRGDLIPADLMGDAAALVDHYDAWLEEFDRWRQQKESGSADPDFIFVGPSGHPFPRQAERRFRERFDALRQELYGAAGVAS